MNDSQPPPRFIPPSRRRDKPILSCALCRRRKLKCDRQQPCRTCVDRGLALSCNYARSNPNPPQAQKGGPNVHDRIDQLEKLVTSLMTAKTTAQSDSGADSQPSCPASDGSEAFEPEIANTPGRVVMKSDATHYSDGAHWTSILDGISELREQLDEISEGMQKPTGTEYIGPDLLYGRNNNTTREDIIGGIPIRAEADRLVDFYFESMDMAPAIFHRPTFLKEYEQFWARPADAPVMWLALLYGVFCLSIRFTLIQISLKTKGSADPEPLEAALCRMRGDVYREKIAQSLVLANYTKCPPYTVEAMLLYVVTEIIRTEDSEFAPSLLLGMLVQITFRMGYHRDPSTFPNISPFKAEMRRRVWSMVYHADLISASHLGIPRRIAVNSFDTKEPRNLTDEDLHENMTELPPDRPEGEMTPMMYTLIKNRYLDCFGRIVDLTSGYVQPTYQEIMTLNSALYDAWEQTPENMRALRASQYIFADSEGSMQRLYLGLSYLKGKLMLHRPYALLGRTDSRYEYSRTACLDAAIEILDFLHLVNTETRPGGMMCSPKWRTWSASWRLSSHINQVFILATTVLSVDLDKETQSPLPDPEGGETGPPQTPFESQHITKAKIIRALADAYPFWVERCAKSKEARKVVVALRIVLGKVNTNVDTPPDTSEPSPDQGSFFSGASEMPMQMDDFSGFYMDENQNLQAGLEHPAFFGVGISGPATLDTNAPLVDPTGAFAWNGLESDYFPSFTSFELQPHLAM